MKFIHISDLHFHRNSVDNVHTRALLDFISFNYPDHKLIITGDIVDDGHYKQYEQAKEALAPFNGKIFIYPGNHDFGVAGNIYTGHCAGRFDEWLSGPLDQKGTFSGFCTPVVNSLPDGNDKVLLIALDTNLQTTNPVDFACGEVGDGQLYTLNNVLADPLYANHTKILFFHHHPFIEHAMLELKDAGKLLQTIDHKVDIVCFGHRHKFGYWDDNRYGVKYFLAADNSPETGRFREIDITQHTITITEKKTPWGN